MNFDQTDVLSLKLRPTLIIGIGATGRSVLQRLQHNVVQQFGGQEDIPGLALLWLDDQSGSRPTEGGSSRFALGLDEPDKILQHLRRPEYAHLHRWWYPGWSSLGQLHKAGLTQSRPAARAGFFYHYTRLRQCLQENLNRVRDPENAQRLLSSHRLRQRGLVAQIAFDQPTLVQVVCAAGDGCAGVLIDLGFLLRDLVFDAAIVRNCWVSLPDNAPDRFKANSYALLKELNHYSLEGHGFVAEWEMGKTVKPMYSVYDGSWLQPGAAAEIVVTIADFLWKEFYITDLSEYRRSLRINVQTQSSLAALTLPEELQRRQARAFSSISQSCVQLAYGAVGEACSAGLAVQVLQSLLGLAVDEVVSLPEATLKLWGEEDTARCRWMPQLWESAAGVSLIHKIGEWSEASWRALQRGHQSRSTHLQLLLQQGQRWIDMEILPQVVSQRQQLFALELESLRKACRQAVEEHGFSLRQIIACIPENASILHRWGESFRRQAAHLSEVQREQSGNIARVKSELLRAEGRKNWDGRRNLLLQHLARRLLEMHGGSFDRPGLFLARLLQEVNHQAFLLCRDLAATLEIEAPCGEVVGELNIMAQQVEVFLEKLRLQRELPRREESGCYDLCESPLIWQEIYPRYVEPSLPASLLQDWLREGGGLLACLTDNFARNQLLLQARQVFADLPRDYSLLQLYDGYASELSNLIEVSSKSASRLDAMQGYFIVAVPALLSGSGSLARVCEETNFDRLQSQVTQIRAGLTHYFSMGYREEIIFLYETVGASVAQLISLPDWREAYLHFYTQAEALHIDCLDQQFFDLMVLEPKELRALREAQEAFLLAVVAGILQQEGHFWFWSQSHPAGPIIHPLGEYHRLITRLTRAPRLRQQLLTCSRKQCDDILRGSSLDQLIELATKVARQKQLLWESETEKNDLSILSDLESKIVSSELYRQHQDCFHDLVDHHLSAL